MRIVVATGNKNKILELERALTGFGIKVEPYVRYLSCSLPKETGETLYENAFIKASFVWERLKTPTFAEDTGLFVEALGGLPGARSARFAGENATYEENLKFLLKMMAGKTNRKARFVTVGCLIVGGTPHFVEGWVDGEITESPKGTGGFGYDPVFLYPPAGKTFAEMGVDEKNAVSHRGKMVEALINLIKTVLL